MPNIHNSIVDEKPAMCFDTGLDPRSFARTKMSQSLVEPGYIVHPDGSHKIWKSTGVKDLNNNMRVFGSPFAGKRLDQLIEKDKPDIALQAVVYWIRAKMFLGDTKSSLNPGAAFVTCEEKKSFPLGGVFFTPKSLSSRCLYIEQASYTERKRNSETERDSLPVMDRYNCPDLFGMDAAAFCAGVMLYRILVNNFPFQFSDDISQDMREGIFVPPHLASPGLDEKLCALINSALLLPVAKKRTGKTGLNILGDMLNLLMGKDSQIVSPPAMYKQVTKEEKNKLEREKKNHLFRQNASVKIRRFAARNKHFLIGTGISLLFVLVIIFSTARSISQRPTTEGMASDSVIVAYYDAFSSLNHLFMEACIQGADKTDLDIATQFAAILKTRQAYEYSMDRPLIIPARVWKEQGGELPSQDVFGYTDLVLRHLAGSENEGMIIYQAEYLMWSPNESYPRNRNDILTLRLDRKKNWRITEILRTER